MKAHNQSAPIDVVIVEDHPSTLEGMQAILQRNQDIAVVGATAFGAEALEMIDVLHPDVVILDIRLPDVNGIDVAYTVRKVHSEVAVLVLTGYDDQQSIQILSQIGVQGYLLKTATGDEIISAVRAVAAGEVLMNGDTGYLQPMYKEADMDKFHVSLRHGGIPCTMRELEVLRLVVAGGQNKKIATTLGITVKTVEFHVGNILSKLGARTRGEAIRIAIQENIITIDEN